MLDHFDLSDELELDLLLEIKNSIRRNPDKFVYRLEKMLTDACLEKDLCPECLSDLDEAIYTERLEVGNSMVPYSTYELFCPNCGWDND